jgi:hypothetical protein
MVGETQAGYPQTIDELASEFRKRKLQAKEKIQTTRMMISELELQLAANVAEESAWDSAYDNLINTGKTTVPKRRRSVEQQQRAPNGKFGAKKQQHGKDEEEEDYDEGEE